MYFATLRMATWLAETCRLLYRETDFHVCVCVCVHLLVLLLNIPIVIFSQRMLGRPSYLFHSGFQTKTSYSFSVLCILHVLLFILSFT